jgi:hypothetical protein
MIKNVVILTTGLSGSSLLASFISRAGYWTGEETIIKDNFTGNYDTFENKKLIELNNELIKSLGCKFNNDAQYHKNGHLRFDDAFKILDSQKYKKFLEICNAQGNWLWKDPRLWLTIGFWHNLLDNKNTRYILLYREHISLWTSLLNKRDIMTYRYLKEVEIKSRESMSRFLKTKNMQYSQICYDHLVKSPKPMIQKMNEFLGTELSIDDLRSVYKGEIGKSTWNIQRLLMALLILVKNYHDRRR